MVYDESILGKFPVFSESENICDRLKNDKSRCLVMTAETGAGKSTVFPLMLLKKFSGRIIMTEPRRLSVLGVSSRISDLLGEECGNTCGYRIRLEKKLSKETRLEIVTEAILVRMLQDDLALEKYNVIVLDEFHERSVSLDLISMFVKEALELRDDLYVVIMSATIDAKRISSYLNNAPIVEVPGRTFPVDIVYKPNVGIESAVIECFNSSKNGNILVFLPGIHEIRKCCENLRKQFGSMEGIEILMLHSSISIDDQRKVLEKNEEGVRKIIVSSAIAETSITVPDVTCVVDSGLCRMNVYYPGLGMDKLVTLNESEFSAAQRAGRAGRTRQGTCIRLWSKNDVRQNEILPEMLRSELSSVVLECAERGEISIDRLNFLDKPSSSSWNESIYFLEKSGMIMESRITEKGKAALKLGIDLRLAGMVLEAKNNSSLMDYVKTLFLSLENNTEREWNDLIYRVEKSRYQSNKIITDEKMLLLEGYSDRLAKRVSAVGERKAEYQFVSGRKALLHECVKTSSEWIVVLNADAGETSALVYNAVDIGGKKFESWVEGNLENERSCFLNEGKVCCEEHSVLGKIVLSSRKLVAEKTDIIQAWKNEISRKGFSALPLSNEAKLFLLRVEFYRQQKGIADSLEQDLVSNFEQWITPFLSDGSSIGSKLVFDAMYWFLEGAAIDREVPTVLEFPNGRKFKVTYEKNAFIKPVVEVIIQRVFGCFKTPTIMGQKVLLKLLSPASRPLQITEDLENFWTTSWPEICKEMKGRYPKHNWDYRITERE